MAEILSSQIKSLAGVSYTVALDLGAGSGTGLDISCTAASITYKRESNDPDGALMTSKASATFLVQNATQRAQFDLLVNANETSYRLRIEREGVLFWVGLVLVDLVTADFASYPYTFTVSATDGISRLKTIDYEQGALPDFATFHDHIFHILAKVPMDSHFGPADEYIRTHSTLWPQGLTPSATVDQLKLTRVGFTALRTVDKTGDVKYTTYYDALLEILKALNARLTFSQGRYVITEIADYARQGGQVVFHRYNESGAALATETLANWGPLTQSIAPTIASNVAVARAGGTTTYLPPLRAVELNYKHFSRQNLLPGIFWSNGQQALAVIPNFRASEGGGKLRLTALVNYSVDYVDQIDGRPGIDETAFIEFSLLVRIIEFREFGDPVPVDLVGVSLLRDFTISPSGVTYAEPIWFEGGANGVYSILVPVSSINSQGYFNIDVITPTIPRNGRLEARLSGFTTYVQTGHGNQYAADITFSSSDFFLEALINGNIEDQYNYSLFAPQGTNAVFSSVLLQRELLFGDGPGGTTFGRIEYNNGTTWENTNMWRRWAGGVYLNTTPMLHGALLARMILALQDDRRQRLDLTLIAKDYVAEGLLECDGDYYIMEDGKFDFPNDEWRGSWFQVSSSFADVSVTPTNTDSNPGGFGATDGDIGPPSPPIFTGSDDQGGLVPGEIPPGLAVNTNVADDVVAGVSIDTITITDTPGDVPLFAGDVLTVTNPQTGQTQQVVVAYDSELGVPGLETDPGAFPYYTETGIVWLVPSTGQVAITTVIPTADFPAGSYVQPSTQFESQLQALLRVAHVQADLFGYETTVTTGFTGWFWRPGRRIGWHIRKVHFAFGQDLGGTTKVNLKYYDATGFRYTVATHNATGLGSVQNAFATVAEGYYRVEVETITGAAPKGLHVIIELIKTL